MPTSRLRLVGTLAFGIPLAVPAVAQDPVPSPPPASAPAPPPDAAGPPPGTASQPAPGTAAPSDTVATEVTPGREPAETTSSPDSSITVIRINPLRDTAAQRAADSMKLTEEQRRVFFQTYAAGVAAAVRSNPSEPQQAIDSVRDLVVQETGKKMRFVRQARLIFSDMYARRARDKSRAPGTEEELWRSPKNVQTLIALYRDKPNASDADLERAMAPSFEP